ncbi:MAG: MBL fold metallo-hydrolase [Bacteroidetes bacterium]|nr:MBL fold metallo-hydrolase [Bacteroidota bacterium]
MPFGGFEIGALETGRFKLDGGAMFGVVPKNLWQRSNAADEQNRIDMTMRSLLLRTGDRVILIDAGVGRKEGEKFTSIFAIDFSDCSIETGLKTFGITAEDVTDVILTHLHFDHVGGAVIRENGALSLQFPHATHYVQRKQWEWGLSPSERDRASYFPDNLLPIEEAGKLQLLDGEEELFPGLRLEIVNGHTFGQQLLRISDGDQGLLFAGDLIPMSAHVPAPWIMGYDLQPLVTLAEKQAILDRAVSSRDVLVYEHDAFFEASLVEKGEKGYTAVGKGSLTDALRAAGRSGA